MAVVKAVATLEVAFVSFKKRLMRIRIERESKSVQTPCGSGTVIAVVAVTVIVLFFFKRGQQ